MISLSSNNRIKFSILLPAFKSLFLKECIDSILVQSYPNFELIIVDDQSPEDLASIVNSYSDSRISYYKNEIGFGGDNVVKNWNRCLEYAIGDYIICMGDDDKLKPDCLKNYIALIEQIPNLDLYHTRTEIIDEYSRLIDIQEPRPLYESMYSMIWYRMNGRKQYIGDFLFKTSTLRSNGGFYELPTGCCSDDISACIAAKERGVANTLEAGFQYRDNRKTLTRNKGNMCGKAQAFISAKDWYEKCVNTEKTCKEQDCLYIKLIKNHLKWYINRNIRYCCEQDLYNRGIHNLFFWNGIRKDYGISKRLILRGIVKRYLK